MPDDTRLQVRLSPEYDQDIINWYNSLENMHRNKRGDAIKEVIRRGLGLSTEDAQSGISNDGNDGNTPSPQSAIAGTAALDMDEFLHGALPEIRRTVEAAVESVLSSKGSFQFTGGGNNEEEEEDPYKEKMRGLLTGDDDDDD